MSFFKRRSAEENHAHNSDLDKQTSPRPASRQVGIGRVFRRRTTSATSDTSHVPSTSSRGQSSRLQDRLNVLDIGAKSDDEQIRGGFMRDRFSLAGNMSGTSSALDLPGTEKSGTAASRVLRRDEREMYQKTAIRRQEGMSGSASDVTSYTSDSDIFSVIHAPFLDKKEDSTTTGCVSMKRDRKKSILSLGRRSMRVTKDKSNNGRRRRHSTIEAPLHVIEAEVKSRKISTGSDKPVRKCSVYSNVSWNDLQLAANTDWSRSSQSSVSTRFASFSSDDLQNQIQARLASCSIGEDSQGDPFASPDRSPSLQSRQSREVLNKDEYAYKQVLRSIVNPLGVPDQRPGYRPLELAYHLKQVFGIASNKHEVCVSEAQASKISGVVLNVQVVEARDLEEHGVGKAPDPYCVLAITDPKMGKISPRGTPLSSPKNSPISIRRRSQGHGSHELEVRRTQILKDTQHPRWNEEFEMDVHDINTEELHVFVWDDKLKNDSSKPCGRPKSTLKTFFKQINRHSFDGLEGYIGHSKICLKDIPASGSDSWHDLFEDRKQKSRADGQCRLRLQLTTKLDLDCVDSTESDMCSIDEYHFIVSKIYQHIIDDLNRQRQAGPPDSPAPLLDALPGSSSYILQQFASQNHLTKISQTLMELVVILECLADGMLDCSVSEKLVKTGIVNFEMEWLTLSSGFSNDLENNLRTVTETEMILFDDASARFIKHAILECELKQNIPNVFPPQTVDKAALNRSIGTPLTLLNLHLWSTNAKTESQQSITNLVANKLQDDVRDWCDSRLSEVQSTVKDSVIPDMKILVGIIDECVQNLSPLYSVNQEFSRLGLDYYKTASLAMEPKISTLALELMLYLDQYQLKYHRYPVNIRNSSQVSLQLYLALKRFSSVVQSHLVQRDVFRVNVFRFQDWFTNAVIFWLQTFKEESIRRMEKALVIDKDVVQVTSLLKYSNSSVDVLSVFSKIVCEWTQVDFYDADIALLGVTKITDTICDGVNHYVNTIEQILENNGYYDFIDNQQFDITDQLCITLNNISHVRQYLEELPTLLKWEEICDNMSLKHENDRVGQMALQTLRNLVALADDEVRGRVDVLMDRITDKIADDLYRYTLQFIQHRPDKPGSVDGILEYLETNLRVLVEKLDPSMFPCFLEHIWRTEVEIFTKLLLTGKPPEYYRQMHSHLGSLRDYIQRGGNRVKTECFPYRHLVDTLKLNSLSSRELIYEYNRQLTADATTPLIHFGHLEIKVGIREIPGEMVTIETSVIRATDLPGVTRNDHTDSFISVNLLPLPVGCQDTGERTPVIKRTRDPVYNKHVNLGEVSRDVIARSGAVISYSAWHHETILPDDFLGEVSILLDQNTPVMGQRQTVEDLPALIMSLKRSKEPTYGPYKVLKERMDWDTEAHQYLERRSVVAGHRQPLLVCAPVQFLVSMVKGKKKTASIKGTSLLQKSFEYEDDSEKY